MDVTDEMAAEEVPKVDVDIPEEDAESKRLRAFSRGARGALKAIADKTQQ